MTTIKTTLLALLLLSCGGGSSDTPDAPTVHEVDAAPDAPVGPDCFTGTPTTHDEIINACPSAGVTRIIKTVHLPLLNPDGSLPPLP